MLFAWCQRYKLIDRSDPSIDGVAELHEVPDRESLYIGCFESRDDAIHQAIVSLRESVEVRGETCIEKKVQVSPLVSHNPAYILIFDTEGLSDCLRCVLRSQELTDRRG